MYKMHEETKDMLTQEQDEKRGEKELELAAFYTENWNS